MADSAQSHTGAADHAVSGNGFLGVLRTGWIETALLTDEQAQGKLIQGNKLDEDSLEHRIILYGLDLRVLVGQKASGSGPCLESGASP